MRNPRENAALKVVRSAAEVSTLVSNARPSRWLLHGPLLLVLWFCLSVPIAVAAESINLSRAEAQRIGQKIWENECGGTITGLTSWNTGENFASLGIGHFIWYPAGGRGPFEESFPDLTRFAASRNVKLPRVAAENLEAGCPWKTRGEFIAASTSPEMKELRSFLAETIDLQTEFLIRRLQAALPKMLSAASAADRSNVERQFERVASSSQGCYALIDYVNFKGEGSLATERYDGEGWGLLQVLQGMSGTKMGPSAAQEFSRSAGAVLTKRVKNSPPARKESRWLGGWLQRVKSYTH